MKFASLLILSLVLSVATLFADGDKSGDWKFSGQSQIRTELDGRDFSNKTYPPAFTSMRTRFGVGKTLFNDVDAFIQIQDSRVWGQTQATIRNISNIDLIQGFVKVNNIFDEPLSIQAGRYWVQYNSGRFLGSNQWNYITRAHDGVRISYAPKPYSFDVFSLTHNNSIGYRGGLGPAAAPYPSNPDEGFNIYGFWFKLPFIDNHIFDVFTYYEMNNKKTNNLDPDLARFTSGFNYSLKSGPFAAIVEFGYQGGKSKNLDVSAYRAITELKYNVNDFNFMLGGDLTSGTSAEDQAENKKTSTYETTYAAAHNFNGYMDYFTNRVTSTRGYGLNDFYLQCVYAPKDSKFSADLSGHFFITNQPYKFTKDGSETESSMLGQELDFVLKYQIVKGATVEWGASFFLPADVMKEFWKVSKEAEVIYRDDPAFWSYIMIRVNL